MSLPTPTVPATLGKIYLINASAVTLQLPNYWNLSQLDRSVRLDTESIPGRDGAVALRDADYGEVRARISGYMLTDTDTNLRADLNELLEHLRDAPLKLMLGGTTSSDLYLMVRPVDHSWRTAESYTFSKPEIDLRALDPYWYKNSTNTGPGTAEITTTPNTQSITYNGTTPTVVDTIVITGRTVSTTHTQLTGIFNDTTGESVEFNSYELQQGEVLTITPNKYTVDHDGANILGQVTNADFFFYAPFTLQPGSNSIRVTTDGAGDDSGRLNLVITYRERHHTA